MLQSKHPTEKTHFGCFHSTISFSLSLSNDHKHGWSLECKWKSSSVWGSPTLLVTLHKSSPVVFTLHFTLTRVPSLEGLQLGLYLQPARCKPPNVMPQHCDLTPTVQRQTGPEWWWVQNYDANRSTSSAENWSWSIHSVVAGSQITTDKKAMLAYQQREKLLFNKIEWGTKR